MATSGGKFRSGKTSRAAVGSTILKLQQWSVTTKGVVLDTTNFESNGFVEAITGLLSADWSLTGDWDAGKNPLDVTDPPGLYPRDDGVDLKLFVKDSGGESKFWSFPLWLCSQSDVGTSASGKVTFSSSGQSQGDFARPVGSV